MEKTNLCRRIRDRLRFEFKQMYHCAENSYAAMDPVGLGYVTKEAFMNSVVVKTRLPFTKEQKRQLINTVSDTVVWNLCHGIA